MESNKRIFKRVPEDFDVRITKADKIVKSKYVEIDVGKSINVSASGLLLNSKEHIEEGTELKIRFLKPNSFDFFESKGKVVRVQKKQDGMYDVAVNFENLTEVDKKNLDYYLTLTGK